MVSSECIAAASRLLNRKILMYQVYLPLLKYDLNVNANCDFPLICLFYRNLYSESILNLYPSFNVVVAVSSTNENVIINSCFDPADNLYLLILQNVS